MPRHRRKHARRPAGPVQVIVTCDDQHHHDEAGYARRGYHLVGEIRHFPGEDGAEGHLHWTPVDPACRVESGPARTPVMRIEVSPAPGAVPVKRYRGGDAPPPWRLRCSCGMDKQVPEAALAARVAALLREFPGRRPCQVPMGRL